MTPKEYLSEYRICLKELSRIEASIKVLQDRATSITASAEGDRVQSSGNKDKIGNLVSTIADMQSDRYECMAETLRKMDEIEKTISKVEDERYRELLHLRYISLKKWEEIANDMGYEVRHITRLHKEALLNIKGLNK